MGKKILVIDDSASIRQQVSMCLTAGGFEVVEAQDGLEAMEKKDGCAMAICDFNMPRMNGLEFAEKAASSMPVIMLTTEGKPDLMAQAKKYGAKGWMVKPFKPEQLLSVVKKMVG